MFDITHKRLLKINQSCLTRISGSGFKDRKLKRLLLAVLFLFMRNCHFTLTIMYDFPTFRFFKKLLMQNANVRLLPIKKKSSRNCII